MVKKSTECPKAAVEHMRGGEGAVKFTHLATKEELLNHARLFSIATLEPGCSIGYHTHENESEIFLITKGSAIYQDDDEKIEVTVGDICICPNGHGHSIYNHTDSNVEVIALIMLA